MAWGGGWRRAERNITYLAYLVVTGVRSTAAGQGASELAIGPPAAKALAPGDHRLPLPSQWTCGGRSSHWFPR